MKTVVDLHTFSIAARDPEAGARVSTPTSAVRGRRGSRTYHNLRVDDHVEPVAELRRIWQVVVDHSKQIEAEYGPAAVRLFGRIKH